MKIKYINHIVILLLLILLLILPYINKTESFITKPPFKIDILYTWVGEYENNNNDIRLSNNNELQYSIRSVIKNLPWINRIFILMNPPVHIPSWFNSSFTKYVTLLDQSDTFPTQSELPNKNSDAIETTIANIPDLAEHFIYMNDDFFIGQKCKYTDFFSRNGKVNIHIDLKAIKPMLLKNKLDILKYKYPSAGRWFKHIPIPYLKSELYNYINEYSDYVNWIRSYKSRNNNCIMCKQFNLMCPCQQQHYPFSIYIYRKKKANIIKFKKDDIFYMQNNYHNNFKLLLSRKNNYKFICINNGTNKDKSDIIYYLNKLFPNKPFFEK